MKVIRTMKPRTAGGGAAPSPSPAPVPAPKKPHAPDPLEPAEEGAPVPGPETGREAEKSGQEAPMEGPGDDDLVPDE
jgi:hypothetical protein